MFRLTVSIVITMLGVPLRSYVRRSTHSLSLSEEGLKPKKCIGEITLEHVDFNHPSRPDVRIVKDHSIMFSAGKTAALVGASGSGKSTIIVLVGAVLRSTGW